MPASWVYAAFVVYIIMGFAVAYTSRGTMTKSVTDFFLANRTIGSFVGALTYSATTYSAFMMVGLAGFTYAGGVGALGFELIYLSGLVLAVFFGPRFWLTGKKFGYVTPSEMLSHRYDNRLVGLVAAVASLVFLIPYSAVQLMGIGYLLESVSRGSIPYMTAVVLATALSVFWAWIAGMRSVAWTDSLQALIMISVATVSVFLVTQRACGGFAGLFAQLHSRYPSWLTVPGPGFFNLNAFIGLTLPWFFFCLSNPQVSQRLFVTRDLRSLRRMLTGFLVFGFVYTLVSVIWGFVARVQFPALKNPDLATPTLLADPRLVSPGVALLIMVSITAAAISTVDSIILTLSSMVSKDIYGTLSGSTRRKHRGEGVGEKSAPRFEDFQLLAGKAFIPVFAILILLFARLRVGLISALSVASSAGLLVVVPATVGAFYWRKGTAAGALASMITGAATSVYLQLTGLKPLGQWPGVWTLAVSTLLFIAVSMVTAPPKTRAEEFLTYVGDAARRHNAL